MKKKHIVVLAIPNLLIILCLFLLLWGKDHPEPTDVRAKGRQLGAREDISQISEPDEQRLEESSRRDTLNHKRNLDSTVKELSKPARSSIDEEMSDSIMTEILSDIPDDMHKRFGPVFFDVLSYLHKDNSIKELIGIADIKDLVHKRYNLNSKTGINLSLTDLCERIRLYNSEYYQTNWPKEKRLLFISASIEEILTKSPDNYSAMLLKARVALKQENFQEATKTYGKVCEQLKQYEKKTILFTELVNVATHLIASDIVSSAEKNLIRELTYELGLQGSCPLALYMEGKPAILGLEGFEFGRENPFDFSKSTDLFESEGVFPKWVMKDMGEIPPDAPFAVRLTDWGYRISTLMVERDARGLVELSGKLEKEQAPKGLILVTEAVAHSTAGRFSAAIPLFELILESQEHTQIPGVATQAQYRLGLAYYRLGVYDKAKELLRTATEDNMRLSPEKSELISKILSDIETK